MTIYRHNFMNAPSFLFLGVALSDHEWKEVYDRLVEKRMWLQVGHMEAVIGILKVGNAYLNHKHMWSKEVPAILFHMSCISHYVFP